MVFDRLLQEINQNKTNFSSSALADISNLSTEEIRSFTDGWDRLTTPSKIKLLSTLVEMGENKAQLDFTEVFLLGLKDPNANVRCLAIEGLWEYEDRTLINPLSKMLIKDSSKNVRSVAASSLGRFAILAEENKLLERDARTVHDSLFDILENPKEDLEVRRKALESVAVFNTTGVGEYIKWAYNSADSDLERSSLFAMGKTGDSYWLTYLLLELENTSPLIRYEAASACGELEDESAIPHLESLIDDDDTEVQLSAIRSIGSIGGDFAEKILKYCLNSDDMVVQDTARQYLGMMDIDDDEIFRHGAE
ncbi:HEAT repeat domain-containing protein [SAR202 cluster bacterium AC-409-J13_OGT_754m]|nr:HEAT repeat domain-containing protein [SAR202 cluster bacterium AC-409-J13_OGT_754m]